MAAPFPASQVRRFAAKHRLAGSSVVPIYTSALNHTHYCVIPNANAYRVSRPATVTCRKGGR
jgi:hypothetical protein